MSLTYSYDVTTPLGQVRLLVGDAPDAVPASLTGARTTWKCALADEEYAFFLATRNQSPWEAAADAMLQIAGSAVALATLIRVGDLQLDNRGLAAQLRAQAAAMIERADAMPAEAIVEPYSDAFQTREHVQRALLGTVPGWNALP